MLIFKKNCFQRVMQKKGKTSNERNFDVLPHLFNRSDQKVMFSELSKKNIDFHYYSCNGYIAPM